MKSIDELAHMLDEIEPLPEYEYTLVTCAERRKKLFADAAHYGAVVFENNRWTAAVCRTYDQMHCFGRAKPKVMHGTNDIIKQCNRRDDEGIDDKYKAVRDSSKWPFVKDGLGREEDSQPFEAGWCVAGGNRFYGNSSLAWGPGLKPCDSWTTGPYFRAKKSGERLTMIVIMEKKTGRLYGTNVWWNRGWVKQDFSYEINGYGYNDYIKFWRDIWFRKIMIDAVEESFKGITDGMTDRTEIGRMLRPQTFRGIRL